MALKTVSIQAWSVSWKCWARKLAKCVMLAEEAVNRGLERVGLRGVAAGRRLQQLLGFLGLQREWRQSLPLLLVMLP